MPLVQTGTFLSAAVTFCVLPGLTLKTIYVLSTECICSFFMDLRTNSDYFPMHHQLTDSYNPNTVFPAQYELNACI
jgi:hypothetical protein